MARQLWLAEAARETGYPVVEVDGWQTRGSDAFYPRGVVFHHTAGPEGGGDMPSLGVLVNGRDLDGDGDRDGPLSHYGIGRSGTIYVVAAGRAYHAGDGGWRGLSGNSSVVGIEPENNGYQPWPDAQLDSGHRLCAAVARRLQGAAYVCGHKEWAPTRKPDPHSLDMFAFRSAVERYIRGYGDVTQFDIIQAEAEAAKNYGVDAQGRLIALAAAVDTAVAEATSAKNYGIDAQARLGRVEGVVNGLVATVRALADEQAAQGRKLDELLARETGGTTSCWIKERM